MNEYNALKDAIRAAIKPNGEYALTAQVLQNILIAIVNSFGKGYQFMGIATAATEPGEPDEKEFYVGFAGEYANFVSETVTVPVGGVVIFLYDTEWHANVVKVAERVAVSSNHLEIDGVRSIIEQDIVNVNTLTSQGEAFLTAAAARAAVSAESGLRIGGQVITYLVETDDEHHTAWVVDQFTGDDAEGWENDDNWQPFLYVELAKIVSNQAQINEAIMEALGNRYTKEQIDGMIEPLSERMGAAEEGLAAEILRAQAAESRLQDQYDALIQNPIVIGPLPSSGQANTIYRVPGTSSYSDYMWNGTQFVLMATYSDGRLDFINVNLLNATGSTPHAAYASAAAARADITAASGLRALGLQITYLLTDGVWYTDQYIGTDISGWSTASNWKTLGPVSVTQNTLTIGNEYAGEMGDVYDVTLHNSGATFASLSALLSDANLSTLIPLVVRKGGMSIKFIQSFDNKYIQWKLTKNSWSNNLSDWMNDTANIKQIIGLNTFSEIGYYSNGIINYRSNIRSTVKIPTTGAQKINYRLRLNNIGQIISFFDADENFLSGISITIDEETAVTQSGTIDLTDSTYVNVAYVAFSCYAYNAEFYASVDNDKSSLLYMINHNAEVEAQQRISTDENIKQIIGTNAEFTEIGHYSDGIKNTNTKSRSTTKIPTTGAQKIEYYLRLNRTGQIVSFFDANDSFLSNISITIDSQGAIPQSGTIDLTEPAYANAAYVAFSCYQYDAKYYAMVGKINSVTEQIKELNENLNKTKPFLYGKRFCALGDSITDGNGNNSYSWYDMLLERYGATAVSLNFAETGQCLRTMADLCTAENMANIDICFVAGGTNQLSNYRLGTIDDDPTPDRWEPNKAYSVGDKVLGGTMERHGWTTDIMAYLYWYECVTAGTSGNTADASAFSHTVDSITVDGSVEWKCIGNPSWYSDMKGICRRVWGFNPKIQIIWIVPIKTRYDADNNVPETFRRAEKFQAIRDFCKGYSIRMIDLEREFPLNTWTKNAIMADDLHPNKNGYMIIQDIICSHIE